jgi:hypothetical protein
MNPSQATASSETATDARTATADRDRFDEVELRGLPSGLRARVRRQLRTDADGRTVEVRDPKGRRKLDRVDLFTATPDSSLKPTERDLTFLLGPDRRAWPTVIDRYGGEPAAWQRATDLARHGAIEIECAVAGLSLGAPICWRLTPPCQHRRKQRNTRRANERADWQQRAATAAMALRSTYPQLAHALATETGPVVRRVLVYAAEDLLAGRSSPGPRAFSQRHFGHTKARDDVGRILVRCEVELEAQIELGVLRAGRNGLSGPIELHSDDGTLRFAGIRGPTDVRLDQPGLRVVFRADTLLVIENRQAAETVADEFPHLGVFWTAGFLGSEGLDALGQLTAQVRQVIACPDADLGGVRIAEQILDVAPDAQLVDIGAYPHEARRRWKPDSISIIGLHAATGGPAGALAQACLQRGYPVEQELSAVDALRDMLRPDISRASAATDSAPTEPVSRPAI